MAAPPDRPLQALRAPTGLTAGGMAGDEAALVAEAGAGNALAFRALIERHMQPVYLTARRLLRDEADAEDAAQEAFLRLWRSAGALEIGPSGVLPWLKRVTSNIAIDRLRAARRLEVTDEVPEQESQPTQLSELVARDAAARVDAALRTLPDRQRAALTLFHYQGMSQREVADCLDVSEEALESLLARARRKMKGLLAEEWRDLLSGTGLT
ncbi:MAG: sigma-70 family RNA polymerase sigma factor [Hyphomicrobiaceae bacterium]